MSVVGFFRPVMIGGRRICNFDQETARTLTFTYAPFLIADKIATKLLAPNILVFTDSQDKQKTVAYLHSMEKKFRGLGVLSALGYIPLIGVIVAIARVFFAVFAPEYLRCPEFQKAQLLRAGIECIPFAGVPLLITDLVLTILRCER